MRLDLYIQNQIPELSRTYIKKAILAGLVFVNNQKANPSYKLKDYDIVNYDIEKIKNYYKKDNKAEIKPTEMEIEVIYEDNNIIVINKLHGVDVHPVPQNMNKTVLNGLMYYFNKTRQHIKPRLVHRLDKDTSGVLLIAKNYIANENFSNYFQQSKVNKVYLAQVKGDFANAVDETGSIAVRNFLSRTGEDRRKVIVSDPLNGQLAVTKFVNLGEAASFNSAYHLQAAILSKINDLKIDFTSNLQDFLQSAKQIDMPNSLILCLPETGRTHQIRVHLLELGYPIIGDRLYGDIEFSRMMLHAWGLGFQD
jgi:23S rRNA pseudouridine1911/1915/1917 synthase